MEPPRVSHMFHLPRKTPRRIYVRLLTLEALQSIVIVSKNVPSLTVCNFNTHPLFFLNNFWHMSSAETLQSRVINILQQRCYESTRPDWQAVAMACSFVRLFPNLQTRYFEKMNRFFANWQSGPRGKGVKRSTLGIMRSKLTL